MSRCGENEKADSNNFTSFRCKKWATIGAISDQTSLQKAASLESTSDCAARQRGRIISQSELADWRSTTTKCVSCSTFRGRDGRQLSLGDQRFGRSHFHKRSRGKLQSDQVAKRTVARN